MERRLKPVPDMRSLIRLPLVMSSAILDLPCFMGSDDELTDKVIYKAFPVFTRLQG